MASELVHVDRIPDRADRRWADVAGRPEPREVSLADSTIRSISAVTDPERMRARARFTARRVRRAALAGAASALASQWRMVDGLTVGSCSRSGTVRDGRRRGARFGREPGGQPVGGLADLLGRTGHRESNEPMSPEAIEVGSGSGGHSDLVQPPATQLRCTSPVAQVGPDVEGAVGGGDVAHSGVGQCTDQQLAVVGVGIGMGVELVGRIQRRDRRGLGQGGRTQVEVLGQSLDRSQQPVAAPRAIRGAIRSCRSTWRSSAPPRCPRRPLRCRSSRWSCRGRSRPPPGWSPRRRTRSAGPRGRNGPARSRWGWRGWPPPPRTGGPPGRPGPASAVWVGIRSRRRPGCSPPRGPGTRRCCGSRGSRVRTPPRARPRPPGP